MRFLLTGILFFGVLLALLLMLQSLVGYYRVSRQLITDHLSKEGERQAQAVERELRNSGGWDPIRVKGIFEEMMQEAPGKYAWLRTIDAQGNLLAQVGNAVNAQITSENIASVFEEHFWISEARETPGGKVRVVLLPLRIRMPRSAPANDGARPNDSARPASASTPPPDRRQGRLQDPG